MKDDGLVAINMIRPSRQLDRKSCRGGEGDPEVLVFAHSLHVGKYVTRYAHESDEEGQLTLLTFQH